MCEVLFICHGQPWAQPKGGLHGIMGLGSQFGFDLEIGFGVGLFGVGLLFLFKLG